MKKLLDALPLRYLSAGLVVLAVTACSPNIETRGFLKEPDWQERIKVGQSTHEEVEAALGTPSTKATFGDETWYYVNTRRESVAFLKPEVVDGEVIAVTFAADGRVSAVNQKGREEARQVAVAEKITPTEGHQMTFMEQLLGNLGRFNSPGSAPGSNRTRGGMGGGPGR